MKAYDRIKEVIKAYIGEHDTMTMTCHGREGYGNVFTRAHYERENLVTKVLYRHDISKDGAEGAAAIQYVNNFQFDAQHPWTMLASDSDYKLTDIPMAEKCKDPLFLTHSRDLNDRILEAFQELGFASCFSRSWKAQGKGIGLEVIIIVNSDGEFGVYECSMNYYIKPDSEKLREQMLAIHERHKTARGDTAPKVGVAVS